MVWILVAALIALTHLVAIVLGRLTRDWLQRVAFSSGLVGVFSFPAVLYFAVKSFCIAGACRGVDSTGLGLALAAFGLLAVTSLISSAVLLVRRLRA